MAKVCPLCNAMTAVKESCPACGGMLADGGRVENYVGPYSPYEATDGLAVATRQGRCVHLLVCPACGYDRRQDWLLVQV